MARLAKSGCKVIGTPQKARFAMKGAAVHRLADGGYIVCQWGLSRAIPDLPALAAFGRMMGVI